jgi:hypothetical protein
MSDDVQYEYDDESGRKYAIVNDEFGKRRRYMTDEGLAVGKVAARYTAALEPGSYSKLSKEALDSTKKSLKVMSSSPEGQLKYDKDPVTSVTSDYRPLAPQPWFQRPATQQSAWMNRSTPGGIVNQNYLMGISSPVTQGGRPIYGYESQSATQAPPASQFALTQRGRASVVGLSDTYYGGGSVDYPTGLDPMSLLQQKFNTTKMSFQQYQAEKMRLHLELSATRYAGVYAVKKDNKFKIGAPESTTERQAVERAERSRKFYNPAYDTRVPKELAADPPSRESFPKKNAYMPDAAEREAYYDKIKAEHAKHVEGLQEETTLEYKMDQFVKNAGFDPKQPLPPEVAAVAAPQFTQLGFALGQEMMAKAGGSMTTANVLRMVQSLGSRYGAEGYDYASKLDEARDAVIGLYGTKKGDRRELVKKAVEERIVTPEEVSRYKYEKGVAPKNALNFKDFAELVTSRLVLDNKLDTFLGENNPLSAETMGDLKTVVQPAMAKLEEARAVTVIGDAEKGGQTVDGDDNGSSLSGDMTGVDMGEVQSMGRVTALADKNNQQAYLANLTERKVQRSFSSLEQTLVAARQGKTVVPEQYTRTGQREYGPATSTTGLQAGLLDDDSDFTVGAAIADETEAPAVDMIARHRDANAPESAADTAARVGTFRKQKVWEIRSKAAGGDIDQYAADTMHNMSLDEDPSTALDDIGALPQDLNDRFENAKDFQPDPLTLLMRQTRIVGDIPKGRKEDQFYSGRDDEAFSLSVIASMLTKSQFRYRDHKDEISQRVYGFGDTPEEILRFNSTDAPIFADRSGIGDGIAAATRPGEEDTKRILADYATIYPSPEEAGISPQEEKARRENQENYLRAERAKLVKAKTYDDIAYERVKALNYGPIPEEASQREEFYGTADPQMQRVLAGAAASEAPTLRQAVTQVLIGEFKGNDYQGLQRQKRPKAKQTPAEIDRSLQVAGDRQWLAEARSVAALVGDNRSIKERIAAERMIREMSTGRRAYLDMQKAAKREQSIETGVQDSVKQQLAAMPVTEDKEELAQRQLKAEQLARGVTMGPMVPTPREIYSTLTQDDPRIEKGVQASIKQQLAAMPVTQDNEEINRRQVNAENVARGITMGPALPPSRKIDTSEFTDAEFNARRALGLSGAPDLRGALKAIQGRTDETTERIATQIVQSRAPNVLGAIESAGSYKEFVQDTDQKLLHESIVRGRGSNMSAFGDGEGDLAFVDPKNFNMNDWNWAQSNRSGFVPGLGNPDDSVRSRTVNARGFTKRLATTLNPAFVTKADIEGEADEQLTQAQGFINADLPDAARTGVGEFVDSAKRDIFRLKESLRGYAGEELGDRDSHLGVDSFLAGSQMMRDQYAANNDLKRYDTPTTRALMSTFKWSEDGTEEEMTQARTAMKRLAGRKDEDAKALHGTFGDVLGFWDARQKSTEISGIVQAQRDRVSELEGYVEKGEKVLGFFGDEEKKDQLGDFIEGVASLASERVRGVSVPYSQDESVYSRTQVREGFRKSLEADTVQGVITRMSDVIDLHEQFRANDTGRGPVLNQEMTTQAAALMGAKTTYIPQAFEAASARTSERDFVFAPGAQAQTDHVEAVKAAIEIGIGQRDQAQRGIPAGQHSAEQLYAHYLDRGNEEQRALMNAPAAGLTISNSVWGSGKSFAAIGYVSRLVAETKAAEREGVGEKTDIAVRMFSKPAEQEFSERLGSQMTDEDRARVSVKTLDSDALSILAGDETDKSPDEKMVRLFDDDGESGKILKQQVGLALDRAQKEMQKEGYEKLTTKGLQGDVWKSITERMRDYGQIGDEYSKSLGAGDDQYSHLVGRTMEQLHSAYENQNMADPLYAKIQATRLLNSDESFRKYYNVENTVGVLDEAQDTNKVDRDFIAARFGKGLVAIGDMGQNVNIDFLKTLPNFEKGLGDAWEGRTQGNTDINKTVNLVKNMRQGKALALASDAVLGRVNEGDQSREGVFTYTSYTDHATEIRDQVKLLADMTEANPDWLDPKNKMSFGLMAPTNEGVEMIRSELEKYDHLKDRIGDFKDKDLSGKIGIGTYHKSKGRTFTMAMVTGGGETDATSKTVPQLNRAGAPAALPSQVQSLFKEGVTEDNRGKSLLGRMQKAFMGGVALSRSNVVIASGQGEISPVLRPAREALKAYRGDPKQIDYTLPEAIPLGKGADSPADPERVRAMTEDRLRFAANTNKVAALTKNADLLIPKDMQLQKGTGAFMAERARRVLVDRPREMTDFMKSIDGRSRETYTRPDGKLAPMGQATVTWDEMSRILSGDTTALVGSFARGKYDKKGKSAGNGTLELAILDPKRGVKSKRATGIVVDFGHQKDQLPFDDLDALTDAQVAATGFDRKELAAVMAQKYPNQVSPEGAPTNFRNQRDMKRGIREEAAYLNSFKIVQNNSGVTSATPTRIDTTNNSEIGTVYARPESRAGIINRDGLAIDQRYLLGGDEKDASNPWRQQLHALRTKSDVFRRKENIGQMQVVSDKAEYDRLVAEGHQGFDLSEKAWANPQFNDKQLAAMKQGGVSVLRKTAETMARAFSGTATDDTFVQASESALRRTAAKELGLSREPAHWDKEGQSAFQAKLSEVREAESKRPTVSSVLGQGQNAVLYTPNKEAATVLKAIRQPLGLEGDGDSRVLQAVDRGGSDHGEGSRTLKEVVEKTLAPKMNQSGMGERVLGDSNYVMSFVAPDQGDFRDRKMVQEGMTDLLSTRRQESPEENQILRTGAGLFDLDAAEIAKQQGVALQMMLPTDLKSHIADTKMSVEQQAQLHQAIQYAQATEGQGGGVFYNDTPRDDGEKSFTQRSRERNRRAMDQQGMLMAHGGRVADEAISFWDGAERNAYGRQRADVHGLQLASSLGVEISNLRGARDAEGVLRDVDADPGTLSDEKVRQSVLAAATDKMLLKGDKGLGMLEDPSSIVTARVGGRAVIENYAGNPGVFDRDAAAVEPASAEIAPVATSPAAERVGSFNARVNIPKRTTDPDAMHQFLKANLGKAEALPEAPPVKELSEQEKFIRQAAGMVPNVERLAPGGIHLVSDEEAIKQAEATFGDKARGRPLRGWSDAETGAVYVRDTTQGAEDKELAKAQMAYATLHEIGELAVSSAFGERPAGGGIAAHKRFFQAHEALEAGDALRMNPIYQGQSRTREALADLFAQGMGGVNYGVDERSYLDPDDPRFVNPRAEERSVNKEFAKAGFGLLNEGTRILGNNGLFSNQFDAERGRSLPQMQEALLTPAEMVARVQSTPEANVTTDRPATMSRRIRPMAEHEAVPGRVAPKSPASSSSTPAETPAVPKEFYQPRPAPTPGQVKPRVDKKLMAQPYDFDDDKEFQKHLKLANKHFGNVDDIHAALDAGLSSAEIAQSAAIPSSVGPNQAYRMVEAVRQDRDAKQLFDKMMETQRPETPESPEMASAHELFDKVKEEYTPAAAPAAGHTATAGRVAPKGAKASVSYDDYEPERDHSGYADADEKLMAQNIGSVFSGRMVMGQADFEQFVSQTHQNEVVTQFHGLATRNQEGDLQLSSWAPAPEGMDEEMRSQMGDMRYVFAQGAQESLVGNDNAQILAETIQHDPSAAMGVGISYDPKTGKTSASYGSEEIKLQIQHGEDLISPEEAMQRAPIKGVPNAGTKYPVDVPQAEIAGNPYTPVAKRMRDNALPEQRVPMEDPRGKRIGLNADAGTGKTYSLIGTAAQLLEQGMDPGQMSMVTFTTKGVQQFKDALGHEERGLGVTLGSEVEESMNILTANALAMNVLRSSDEKVAKALYGENFDPKTFKVLESNDYERAPDPDSGLPRELIKGDAGHHPGDDVMMMHGVYADRLKELREAQPKTRAEKKAHQAEMDAIASIERKANKQFGKGSQFSEELPEVKVARYLKNETNKIVQGGRFGKEYLSYIQEQQKGGASVNQELAIGRMAAEYHKRQGAANVIGQEEATLLALQAAQKPANSGMLAGFRKMFEHTFVDEAQDLSKTQANLINLMSNGRGMTVAGDTKQAIFGWRGGIANFMDQFGLNQEQKLTKNWRSGEGILGVVRAAFGINTEAANRPDGTRNEGGKVSYDYLPTARGGKDAPWKAENQRMSDDIIADLLADPKKLKALQDKDGEKHHTLVTVPTHARMDDFLRDDKDSLKSRLGTLGVDLVQRRDDDELKQETLRNLRMKDIPQSPDDAGFEEFHNHFKDLRKKENARRGVELVIGHGIKAGEWKDVYAGGLTGEGSGQVYMSQLMKRLGMKGQESQDPALQDEYQGQKNLAYVAMTRAKDMLRMYGSGPEKSRLLDDVAGFFGLGRKPIRPSAGAEAGSSPTPRTETSTSSEAMPPPPAQDHTAIAGRAARGNDAKRDAAKERAAFFDTHLKGLSEDDRASLMQMSGAYVRESARKGTISMEAGRDPADAQFFRHIAAAQGHQIGEFSEPDAAGRVHAPISKAVDTTEAGTQEKSKAPAPVQAAQAQEGNFAGGSASDGGIPSVHVANAEQIGAAVAAKLPDMSNQALSHSEISELSKQLVQAQLTPSERSFVAHDPSMQGVRDSFLNVSQQAQALGTDVFAKFGQASFLGASYDVTANKFRAPKPPSGGGDGPRDNVAAADGGDSDDESGFKKKLGGIRTILSQFSSIGNMAESSYEKNLKDASAYNFAISRGSQITGISQQELMAISERGESIRGVSRTDMAAVLPKLKVDESLSPEDQVAKQEYEARQVVKFAKLADMDPGEAAEDLRQLGTLFKMDASEVGNIIESARIGGGGLASEKEMMQAAELVAPYVKKDAESFKDTLAMVQVLDERGVKADRGTRQLIQSMSDPSTEVGILMKSVHDAKAAEQGLTQEEADKTFTNQGYWQFQLETAQLTQNVKQAPLKLQEYQVMNATASRTMGPVSVADVMSASASNLGQDQIDFRMKQRNLELEERNLGRQSRIIDIDEQITRKSFEMQDRQFALEVKQVGYAEQQYGIKQQQFEIQKSGNQLDLRSTRLDIASMQLQAQYAPEMTQLQTQRAKIDFATQRRELDLEKRSLPIQKEQMALEIESAKLNMDWQRENIEFKRWYDTAMYGEVGEDRSYRAYTAMKEGNVNAARNTYQSDSINNKTIKNVAGVPVMGLANEQFYAGITHQLSQAQYGRNAFRSEAAYNENVDYIKKQAEFYERRMAIEDKAREFGYRMQDKQLALQEKQYEVQKKLLELQEERLEGRIADAEKTIPLDERLLDLQEIMKLAELGQMPERINIALEELGLKERSIPLSEESTRLGLEEEGLTLADRKAGLADQAEILRLQKEQSEISFTMRRDELSVQSKNLDDQLEIQRRQGELLSMKNAEVLIQEALLKEEARMLESILISRNTAAKGLRGTEDGEIMNFIDFFKGIVEGTGKQPGEAGYIDPKALEAVSSSWTEPAMQAAIDAMKTGDYDKARAALEGAGVPAEGTDGTVVDQTYQDSQDAGAFSIDEFMKIQLASRIAAGTMNQAAEDTTNAMYKVIGGFNDLTGAMQGPLGALSGPSNIVGHLIGFGVAVSNFALLFKGGAIATSVAGGLGGIGKAIAGFFGSLTGAGAASTTLGTFGTALSGFGAILLPLVGAGAILVELGIGIKSIWDMVQNDMKLDPSNFVHNVAGTVQDKLAGTENGVNNTLLDSDRVEFLNQFGASGGAISGMDRALITDSAYAGTMRGMVNANPLTEDMTKEQYAEMQFFAMLDRNPAMKKAWLEFIAERAPEESEQRTPDSYSSLPFDVPDVDEQLDEEAKPSKEKGRGAVDPDLVKGAKPAKDTLPADGKMIQVEIRTISNEVQLVLRDILCGKPNDATPSDGKGKTVGGKITSSETGITITVNQTLTINSGGSLTKDAAEQIKSATLEAVIEAAERLKKR